MTIHERINEDMISAMKSKNKDILSLLRVVKGEFGRVGKDLTDEQSLPIIKKMVQNAKELNNMDEVHILEVYLPQQMDELELKRVCMNYIMNQPSPSMKMMGQVMGYLKENFGGQYDGKLASSIVRELLS